jgi:hypothetical protein
MEQQVLGDEQGARLQGVADDWIRARRRIHTTSCYARVKMAHKRLFGRAARG